MKTTDFENHEIIKILMPIVTEYTRRQTPEKIISKATPKESVAIDILLSFVKITECIDQINFSIDMLSGFRQKKNGIMNRHDHILFMMENFYLRITSIFDRTLLFTNLLFDIGLPDRECRESTIIKNKKVKGTKVQTELKKLSKYTNEFRQIRNQVAHSTSIQDEKLTPIQSFCFLMEQEYSHEFERYKTLYKVESDKYISEKKTELTESSEKITCMISDFFDSMIPYVKIKLNL